MTHHRSMHFPSSSTNTTAFWCFDLHPSHQQVAAPLKKTLSLLGQVNSGGVPPGGATVIAPLPL
jgi:hypothetical protein